MNALDRAGNSPPAARLAGNLSSPAHGALLDVALIGGFALLVFHFAGIGNAGSDDNSYIHAARHWLEHFPYISSFVGNLRLPAILPIPLSMLLLGESETTVALPNLLYALGIVVITYGFLRALADRATSVLAAVLFAASPLVGEMSLTAGVDNCELFFLALSLFTFLYATSRRAGATWYLAAGAATGLAFLTRESSVALLVFYGVLFLAGFGGRRHVYWLMAAGFLAVFASEILFYLVATGDPLYRIKLVAAAVQSPDPLGAVGIVDFRAVRIFNFSPLIDPLLLALTHPKFALVFWAAAAALVWSAIAAYGHADARRLARLFLLFGAIGGLVTAFVLAHLALIPRYFLVPIWSATVVVALWIRYGVWPRHRLLATAVVAALLVADLVGAAVSNKSPLFAERVLASLAAHSAEPIHTDAETAYRGQLLFDWAGAGDRVTPAAPAPGDLFLHNPKSAAATTPRTQAADWAPYTPRPGWTVLERIAAPQRPLAAALRYCGIDTLLPRALVERMSTPAVILYRVGP